LLYLLDISPPTYKSQYWESAKGLFCLPESATTLAGMLRLHGESAFGAEDRIVLAVTGSGTKNLGVIDVSKLNIRHASLEDIETHFN
jgi:threonine synthase